MNAELPPLECLSTNNNWVWRYAAEARERILLARIAELEAEVERLRSKQEEDRLRRLSRFLIPKTTFVSENGD